MLYVAIGIVAIYGLYYWSDDGSDDGLTLLEIREAETRYATLRAECREAEFTLWEMRTGKDRDYMPDDELVSLNRECMEYAEK